MNKYSKWTAWLGAGAVILTIGAGCADRNNNGQPDDVATTGEVAQTTDNVADAAVPDTTGNVVSNTVEGAGSAIEGAADAATYTPKIKTALGANAGMAGSNIDVDTNGTTNTVTLKGTVTSSAQKTLAEGIAKKNVPAQYKVDNQLTMGNKM